ncbi:MAG: acyl-CoA-binding protein [Bacteroidetes bacterium HGW-Bacteroidetes-2]|jgi:acyl-CoA-binding protein|nr:MAG: acyl-CoA-binding protein [Bacteroidetes bacterium HGW-Bacteroidetes-2]
MTSEELQIAFEEAVNQVNNHTETFPADLLLRLYAYYKKANNSQDDPNSKKPLINAFKSNALFQARFLTPDEAKKEYIDAVTNYFLYRK